MENMLENRVRRSQPTESTAAHTHVVHDLCEVEHPQLLVLWLGKFGQEIIGNYLHTGGCKHNSCPFRDLRSPSEVVTGVSEVATGVSEVATGVSEMATGVSEVATGVSEVVTGVSEVATGVSELATGVSLNWRQGSL